MRKLTYFMMVCAVAAFCASLMIVNGWLGYLLATINAATFCVQIRVLVILRGLPR